MSVILDALRRARGGTPAGPATDGGPRAVPAGLVLTPASRPALSSRTKWAQLLGAALIVVLAIWAGLRIASRFGRSPSPEPPPVALAPSQPAPVEVPEAPVSRAAPDHLDAQPTPMPASRSGPSRPGGTNRGSRVPQPASIPGAAPPIEAPETPVPAPASAVNHFELALRYQRLGDFEGARTHYLAVLAADEFNVEARNNLGLLYHGRGMTAEAVAEFKRALLIDPGYIKARSNLAVVLTSQGRLAEARAELREALDIAPRNVDLLVNLALVEKADQHPEQAMERLVRAIGVQPDHAVAHYNLAVLYEERESLALAYDHFNAFLKYAGPEHGALLTDVQNRIRLIEPRLQTARD